MERPVHPDEVKGLDQLFCGLIGRTVVYDDDLEQTVVEFEERAHAADDGNLLVVRRDEDGNRQVKLVLELVVDALASVAQVKLERALDHGKKQVGSVQNEVHDKEDAHIVQIGLQRLHHAVCFASFAAAASPSR